VAIGANESKIAKLIVRAIAIDMIELEWDWSTEPYGAQTNRAALCEYSFR